VTPRHAVPVERAATFDRRHATAALLCALGSWDAGAQASGRLHRVGVLGVDSSDGSGLVWEAFVDELAKRGYIEGRNLVLERRFGEHDRVELLEPRAAELVASKVDVIYAAGGVVSALAAKRATSTIPIVFFSAGDPVAVGLVQTLARPGGNVTGNATQGVDIVSKGLQILAEASGRMTQFVLFLPAGMRSQVGFARTESLLSEAGARLGAKARFVEVTDVEQIGAQLRMLAREGVDAVLLFDFPMFRAHMDRIAALLIERKLPSYGYARAGFLMHYDMSRPRLARSAAGYVDRILKGAKPAELPVEQVNVFELVINLKTAKAIGLTVPKSLLLRADEVIE
jgi:putative ABC transport system substrate-binding protein